MTQTFDPPPPPRVRIEWFELTCLPCGELAGYVENGRVVRPVYPRGIRLERGRPLCGRCGGVLLSAARGVASSRAAIG
ncbi:MAG: hypothetical protein M3069_03850 [Chloroflexota bacterium]|nr:hypothetical protein [Chloroflexota bacterium]